MITTIIFDLDGTLMNTLDDLHESVCHALQEYNLPLQDKVDTRRFLGNGVKNLVERSIDNVCPDVPNEMRDNVFMSFRDYYMQHSMDKTVPYEGIITMLRLCKTKGLNTAIVSNKLEAAVENLHKSFFADCIDVAIGETTGIRRKPAPDMVNEAIHQLSLKHNRIIHLSECVYVGDSEVDLATANNAGIPCISCSWGYRDRSWLEECGAKIIINKPDELLTAL